MLKKNFNQLSAMLYEALKEMLPLMVNKEVNKIAKMTVPIYVAEGLLLDRQKNHVDVTSMIVEAIQKERDNLRAGVISDDEQLRNADLAIWLSLKIKFEKITTAIACRPSATRPRDHDDAHYDEVPTDKVSQDLWEEVSEEIDEARVKKVVND
ncbi:hypothetical protein Tco_1486609, partial [Tanacetum coccineum]